MKFSQITSISELRQTVDEICRVYQKNGLIKGFWSTRDGHYEFYDDEKNEYKMYIFDKTYVDDENTGDDVWAVRVEVNGKETVLDTTEDLEDYLGSIGDNFEIDIKESYDEVGDIVTAAISFEGDYDTMIAQDCYSGMTSYDIEDEFKQALDVTDYKESNGTIYLTGKTENIEIIFDYIKTAYNEYEVNIRFGNGEMTESYINEATKIPSFDKELQAKFNKVAAHFAVVKSHAINAYVPRNFVAKMNEFILKFMEFKRMVKNPKEKQIIQNYIDEVETTREELAPSETAEKKKKVVKPAGHSSTGAGRSFARNKTFKKEISDDEAIMNHLKFANPNKAGGEYYDVDGTHVWEMPEEQDTEEEKRILKLRNMLKK